jgi:hypothetical protein
MELKMKKSILAKLCSKSAATICLLILAGSLLSAQERTDVPPVSSQADNGPSMEVTAKFIQEKLRANSFWSDVTIDPTSCEFTAKGRYDPFPDNSVQSITFHFSLRDVSQVEASSHGFTIDMKPGKSVDHFKETTQKRGKPHRSVNFQEPTFYSRTLPDEDLGNRLAKAMIHAIDLCGRSGQPEPF